MMEKTQLGSVSEVVASARFGSPSEALARFQAPTRGLMDTGSLRSQEFARYGFRVSGLGLLIKQGTDSELVEASGIAPIPLSAEWLTGVMNRRGHPVPVFSLRAALGLPSEDESEKPMVLVLDKGSNSLGVEVEGHPVALRDLAAADISASLHPRLAPFVAAAWIGNGELWMEFDHIGFFSSLVGDDTSH